MTEIFADNIAQFRDLNVVWFKRDLRIRDNKVLCDASARGQILPLYILEPDLWLQKDMSYRHFKFLEDAIDSLKRDLQSKNSDLVIKVGNAVDVFSYFKKKYKKITIWSHKETWNGWTYQRDKIVGEWAKVNNIDWIEYKRNGVVRGLQNRDGWSKQWYKEMKMPICELTVNIQPTVEPSDPLPSAENLSLEFDGLVKSQTGSREEAERLLNEFLNKSGKNYSTQMSSPLTAHDSCSRLSAYIAFGIISVREVFQALELNKVRLKDFDKDSRNIWNRSYKSFSSRLRWHCHFIQKMEDQPQIEFSNLHSAYDGIRENKFDYAKFHSWKFGNTGFPMVDACMRSLIATGWLNFRMSAMLISFASYHLWLHWRETSLWLAKLFVDYEPGIHYSQVQMQSGTTGINTIRIYNPVKQGNDHDPEGIFVKTWLPELSDISKEYIHTPWLSPVSAKGYLDPIVNELSSRKLAAKAVYEIRKNSDFKKVAKNIYVKHGSRKRSKLKFGISKNKISEIIHQEELPL